MADQLRATGTPDYSYLFAARRFYHELSDVFANSDWKRNGDGVEIALQLIMLWLDRSEHDLAGPTIRQTELLTRAFIPLYDGLEFALSGWTRDRCEREPAAMAIAYLSNRRSALTELCRTYEFGDTKYGRGNFRNGAPMTSYVKHALSHVVKWFGGQERDVESGLHTLAHACWNIVQACGQPPWRDDRLPAAQLAEPREQSKS